MLTRKQAVQWRIKRLLKVMKGEEMDRTIKLGIEVMEAVRDGELPLKTAEQIHKTYHRIVMDRYATCREEEMGLRGNQLLAAKKAMAAVK